MTKLQATAEVFMTAFEALPKKGKNQVIVELVKDKVIREDLIDLAIAEARHREPSRSLKQVLAVLDNRK